MNAQLSVVQPPTATATSPTAAPVRGFVLHVDLGPEAFAASIDDVMVTADTLRELVHEWLPQARTRTAVTATVPGPTPEPPPQGGSAPGGTPAARTQRAGRETRGSAPSAREGSGRRAAWPAEQEPPPERSAATLRARLAALPDVPSVLVDLTAHEVTVGGRVLRLTTKEFDLFAYLVRAQGRVVSRTELHRTVWRDRDVAAESRTVDVHVRRLRAVPELAGLVATVHGSGYRVPPRPCLTVAE